MIYLDNNATTFLDPLVADFIKNHIDLILGNASSMHQSGQKARQILVDARSRIARLLNVTSEELCFTSSATEAINLLLNPKKKPAHIISSSLEHTATLAALRRLEGRGSKVSYLKPEKGRGSIAPDQIVAELREETGLIVIMGANNETGVRSDIEDIALLAQKRSIPLIVDGVALFGKEPFSLPIGVTGFCVSGHKMHGPKGLSLAVIRKGYHVEPLIVGGPQQFMRRGGTEDVVAIAAFAKVIEIAIEQASEFQERISLLRNWFEASLKECFPNIRIHGENERRVANVSNVSFIGKDAESLLIKLDLAGIAASHGSACSSGALEPSHVLMHMGLASEEIRSAVRFSLSRFTTKEEITKVLSLLVSLMSTI
jgi:cysteine desulfurase